MATERREHHPRRKLQNAMREYLASKGGDPAPIREIKAALKPKLSKIPDSSYRSGPQNERYVNRASRSVFKLRGQD